MADSVPDAAAVVVVDGEATDAKKEKATTRKKKVNRLSVKTYNKRILTSKITGVRLSSVALEVLDSLHETLNQRMMDNVSVCMRKHHRLTMYPCDIITALRMCGAPRAVVDEATAAGNAALQRFNHATAHDQ